MTQRVLGNPVGEPQNRRRAIVSTAQFLTAVSAAVLARSNDHAGASPMTSRKPGFGTAERCIFLFMSGGVSQFELFDDKPELTKRDGQTLPESFTKGLRFSFLDPQVSKLMACRRPFRKYGEAGFEFSDLLPHLARQGDELTMIRSMQTDAFDHSPAQWITVTGTENVGHPSIGSWVSHGLGSESDTLPVHVAMWNGRSERRSSALWGAGFLPARCEGTLFSPTGEPIRHLLPPTGVTSAAQLKTITAINDLDRMSRSRHWSGTDLESRISDYQLAFRMQMEADESLNVANESAYIHRLYGTDRTLPEASGYARSCLLARKLIESGVRFVNVFHSDWDHHFGMDEKIKEDAYVVDQPVAALVSDLKQRGLLDTTLVVWASEFGRTPLGEFRRVSEGGDRSPATGRDHHPNGFTIWMAGGGLKNGLCYGQTDELGWSVTENPVHVHDWQATILHLLGLDHEELTFAYQGRNQRLTDVGGNVVSDILA